MLTTIATVVFYYYPGIISTLLSIYSCQTVDRDDTTLAYYGNAQAVGQFWVQDYSMQCYQGWHMIMALAVGVPGVLLWCISVPLGTALFLRRNQHRLDEPLFEANFGMMYQEYLPDKYYHECLVMLRKLAIVAVIVFVGYVGLGVQLLVALLVLAVAVLVQVRSVC